ncbi:MAG: enoyl-CoA hydratase/isomerase family protein, partial [Myxococcales bacterium]|nr:enoyl-CoA hydratase/isomerase family protein [Myxococcales bacterium]
MDAPVLKELDGEGVLLVTLNRPAKKNAFNEAQWDAASEALREAREDPRVAALVITGAGGDFTAGVDLSSFARPPDPREDGFETGYDAFMATLIEFDKPLLAAVRGVGVGIGCTLLFHCDVVYGCEGVRLRRPFV